MANLELPFDVMDVFHGVHLMASRPENGVFKRDKPRASGLTGDAREIAYMMAGIPPSNPHAFNPERMDGAYTAEQGRLMEDLTFDAISHMAVPGHFKVVGRQVSLPDSYFVSGHPDGVLEGTKIGVEHKHYGRFAYKEIARDGIWGPKGRDVLAQSALYGDALGWDSVLIMITSQDASSMRMELNTNAFRGKGIHPKLMMFHVSMEQLSAFVPQLKARAEFFINWAKYDGNPGNVNWESEPNPKKFPWSYSEYTTRAILDGPGLKDAPPAFMWET